jgi:dipeptidase D
MAILESEEIVHPSLEALFTIDEETGMTGAKNLDNSILDGEILLNLDTEEDDEIGIGCAGGVDITATKAYGEERTPENHIAYKITVKGLNGGHSGMDIIKGLGNANKLMNRVLYNAAKHGARVSNVEGGGLRNAIPRESNAVVTIDKSDIDSFLSESDVLIEAIKKEYASLEENLSIEIEQTETPENIMSQDSQNAFLKSIYAARNGVYRMSPEVKGLVETSNNIAKISAGNGEIKVSCLTRSSVESNKNDLANSLVSAFELGGFEVNLAGEYPGWKPNPDSDIVKVVDKTYEKLNGEKAHIAACHAGLECGIIGSHYPEMDMVSFGPTIRGAHSPDERVSISSVQKFWELVLEILKNIPAK